MSTDPSEQQPDRPRPRACRYLQTTPAIELLFKWLKQHLQLKRFFGRSANAVKLQLLCAMMAYLLLKPYRQNTRTHDSLHLLYARIAGCLFERPQTLYACYAQRRRERAAWMEAQERLF